MYRDVAINSILFLQALDGYLIADATISENLILFQTDDFANAHAGINAKSEDGFVAA